MTRRVRLWIAAVLTAAGLMAGLAVAAHAGVGQAHPSVALYPTAVEYAVMSFGFAIYSAARDRYEDAVLLTGSPAGTLQEALDTACTVHRAGLGHEPPTNLRAAHLSKDSTIRCKALLALLSAFIAPRPDPSAKSWAA